MKTFHLFLVKYLGATNTRSSRVVIKSTRFDQKVTIPFDYTMNQPYEMAKAYLEEKGFNIIGVGESGDEEILISDTFERLA